MIRRNTLLIIILITISLNTYAQRIFNEDYYMVSVDDTKLFRQSNDTLYLYKCSPDFIQLPRLKASDRYKILSVKNSSVFSIIKLEKLDTILLTTDPYPLKRYYLLALKNANNKAVGQLMVFKGLSKDKLNKIIVPDLSNKFFSTLISERYKNELLSLKPIVSRQDVNIIVNNINSLKSEKYKLLIEQYNRTDLNDMYNFYINSELLYLVCLDNGYNPINASGKIGAILKKK